jgi:RHS repeat-associated protein
VNLSGNKTSVNYDVAGNIVGVTFTKPPSCYDNCGSTYTYTWDELGRLASASRSDFQQGFVTDAALAAPSTSALAAPSASTLATTITPDPPPNPLTWIPKVTLSFTYDAHGARVLRGALTPSDSTPEYTVSVFSSLRLEHSHFPDASGDYEHGAVNEGVYLTTCGASFGRLVYASNALPSASASKIHVYLEIGDHLGSTAFVVDYGTGELVERITYQTGGGVESDFRPDRWQAFRESVRQTGHDDDVEGGVIYFGHRYYMPGIGRWLSPDPLATHASAADPNLYAFVHGSPLRFVDPSGLDGCDDQSGLCANDGPNIFGAVAAAGAWLLGGRNAEEIRKSSATVPFYSQKRPGEILRPVGPVNQTNSIPLNMAENAAYGVTNLLIADINLVGWVSSIAHDAARDAGFSEGDIEAFNMSAGALENGVATGAEMAGYALEAIQSSFPKLVLLGEQLLADQRGSLAIGDRQLGLGLAKDAASGREGFMKWASRMGFFRWNQFGARGGTDLQRIDAAMLEARKVNFNMEGFRPPSEPKLLVDELGRPVDGFTNYEYSKTISEYWDKAVFWLGNDLWYGPHQF